MTPAPDLELGGRYVLVRRIAVGGMGEVWEAKDGLLDRSVAVKVLKEEFRTASTFLARFRAEARHAGQLSHRGIATVYDYGETSELAFLVMELVRGRALSELIVEQPAMPTTTKLSILGQAAEALHAAHEAGVVHRDVKPGNLMVRDDGTVKVTDFGIARALTSAPLTDHGQMIGTPAYLSPEQATGAQVTGASDIYSLAVVAYEMFAGHPPFTRDTPLGLALAHVNDPPPPLPDTVPRRVAEIIESSLAKDPSLRPSSAADFALQMRRELATMTTAPPAVLPPHQDEGPTPTTVLPLSSGPVAGRASTRLAPVAIRHGLSYVLAVAFAGLLILVGAMIWAAARPGAVDDARADAVASTISGPTLATETSSPTQPLPTQPLPTQPPPTQPTVTQPSSTEPRPTQLPPATQPTATQPSSTEPPSTQPPRTQPPSGPTTPAVAREEGRVDESEAVAFVIDYYERVGAGDYGTTWELLSPEFRDARNLTFESYVSYWENTTLEVRDLQFVAGPGADESRVLFEARYYIGSRVVDETDELTLRRHSDGHPIITEQRTV